MHDHYVQATIPVSDKMLQETLIALLSEAGFDGFEQTNESLIAYTHDRQQLTGLQALCDRFAVSCHSETLPVKNWNEVWESNFQPVVIPGFCAVLAPFHEKVSGIPYEIRIMPKMSFGTGHHATTSMMLESLQDLDLKGKKVLDFGAGTGVLAILSKMLGAASVTAIDNDDWAYENCLENVAANHTEIRVLQGSLETVTGSRFDILLANINRHILLQYMQEMKACLLPGGLLLLSGILEADEAIIREAAAVAGFSFQTRKEKNNWLCLSFQSTAA